ncbi:hypothetical protein PC117_g14933 [Phytophthora cactorum]|uniref:Uncharacterized protein n=1 Tax=Phytophthora cactorum TaxID=29920 RepID=A0A8T1CQZ5_9STRA|nr:hypothetical protein PC117_g14933 [Phytophthora cactorum]
MLDQSPHLTAKRQRLEPPADEELSERGISVLSSGEDESEGSSCSDDYEEDDFCSDELPSDGSSGEESDAYISKEEEEELAEPYWEHDPVKKWPVWQIDDVRFDSEDNATEVSVLWDSRPTPNSRRIRRWEPAAAMIETHEQEVQLAIRCKGSGMEHFQAFCKTDEFGQRLIRASDNIAAQVIGRPDMIPETVVDQFLADELKEGVV